MDGRPSFFWYDTEFSFKKKTISKTHFQEKKIKKSVSYQKKDTYHKLYTRMVFSQHV